ncbi:hypothetical protein Tco_1163679 [Tanacetum coccineum]
MPEVCSVDFQQLLDAHQQFDEMLERKRHACLFSKVYCAEMERICIRILEHKVEEDDALEFELVERTRFKWGGLFGGFMVTGVLGGSGVLSECFAVCVWFGRGVVVFCWGRVSMSETWDVGSGQRSNREMLRESWEQSIVQVQGSV